MAVDDRRRSVQRSLQVAAWRGSRDVALLTPAPDRPTPSIELVAEEIERLRVSGIGRILTGALHRAERAPFLANGFVEHEQLHLLRHDLVALPAVTGEIHIRRARRRDLATVLDIDARAFDPFWTLDARGLDDAVRATPVTRYRVVGRRAEPAMAYAITGRAADRGYLQRLAVHPDHHRSGVGRALVADALHWLRRSGSRTVMVNTQRQNRAALELYAACGFREEPNGLTVLALDLGENRRATAEPA